MNSRLKVFVVTMSTCLAILLLLGTMFGESTSPEGAYRQLAVFTEVMSRIRSDYVEEPDLTSVTLGALNGLLESIDPFASYLSADQYKQYLAEKDSENTDVGLILSKKFGYIGIVGVVPGSPAAKAGLSTGDVLETIAGVDTRNMPLAYAEILLRGEAASTVDLTVLRVQNPEAQTVTLTREVFQFPLVTSRMLPNQIAYIRPETLTADKTRQVAEALSALTRKGAKKLILDLRDCSVGEPEEGIALADLFLDEGLITYLRGQKVKREDYRAKPTEGAASLPLVVMTNRGTADGAEIAAAALLDNKRAEVVGERTYGDAAMRRAIDMEDGAAIILSVAKYYSPGGKAIQDEGVTPSVVVATTPEPTREPDSPDGAVMPPALPEKPEQPEEDIVLKKAIEVLTQGVSQTAASRPMSGTSSNGP